MEHDVLTIQDISLYAVIVPVLPFAIQDRAGVPQEDSESRHHAQTSNSPLTDL